ncbi:MAG: hypothetical protein ABI183_10940, partial [Polyangiaceae bacterium]
MKRLERFAALLIATVFFAGCSPYERSTSIALRDPSAVRYIDQITGKPIPYSSGRDGLASTELERHDLRVAGDHFEELIVTGYETADGSLITHWRTDALPGARNQVASSVGDAVLENDGKFTIADHLPLDPSSRRAEFAVCGRFDDLGGQLPPFRGRYTTESVGTSCNGLHDLKLVAATDWSNVERVHHISKNDAGRNIMLAVVTSALTGIAGSVLLAEGGRGEHPAETVGGFAALGLG